MVKKLYRTSSLVFAVLSLIGLGLSLAGLVDSRYFYLSLMLSIGLGLLSLPKIKSYAFTLWVILCVGFALLFPQTLIQWGEFKLSSLIIPLTQIIMFGMGSTLSLIDFKKILLTPWPVFIGVLLQFGIMPFVGYGIAVGMGFEGELAAGIVLIGSVSGGVASNLMAYIANANVALSVTMTVVSTCLAPVMTPLLMSILAGSFIAIDTWSMMMGVVNIIVLPVLIGLLANKIFYGKSTWTENKVILLSLCFLGIFIIIGGSQAAMLGRMRILALQNGLLMAGFLLLLIGMIKLIFDILLNRSNNWIDQSLPVISMVGICIILAVIIAQTHDVLMSAGLILLLAAILHNAIGYLMGYGLSKVFGGLIGKLGFKMGWFSTDSPLIDEASCRTVAFEVGMQNGGMATGLAMDVLKSHVAALPPNLFGTWMNISGSMLANYWKRK